MFAVFPVAQYIAKQSNIQSWVSSVLGTIIDI